MTKRIVIGISGSSGAIYGVRLLEVLAEVRDVETHVVISRGAEATIEYETSYTADQVRKLASVVHSETSLGDSIASGTFLTEGMVVAPCSIKTLSSVANSYNSDLITRAADVCLKERRKLVLVVRETPLHVGHLRLMTQVTETGAVKKRSFISSSPSVSSTFCSRSAGRRRGRSLYWAMMSSFFIECSHPTSSVTLTW